MLLARLTVSATPSCSYTPPHPSTTPPLPLAPPFAVSPDKVLSSPTDHTHTASIKLTNRCHPPHCWFGAETPPDNQNHDSLPVPQHSHQLLEEVAGEEEAEEDGEGAEA